MIFAVIAFVVLFVIFLWLDCRKPLNFPLGPKWFPIIGSAMSISNARTKMGMLTKAIRMIAENYPGNRGIIGFKVGKDRVVMAVNGEALTEMMLNPDLDGRPFGPFYETRTWNLRRGVLLTDADFWQVQRRFVVRHLKEFGFARKGMTEIIHNEAEHCLNDFREMVRKQGGKQAVVPMKSVFSVYVLNTLWLMMAGIRYTNDNKDLKLLQSLLSDLFVNIDMIGALFSHFPFLRFLAPDASGYNEFVNCHNNMHTFLGREVENHKRNFNPSDEPRDLIDVYLRMLHTDTVDGVKIDESFSEQQLLAICLDMFIAGSETTTKTTNFIFLYLVRNPDVAAKVQDEIDEVIGRERLPCLDDRQNMPYCEAVVYEGLRMFMSHTFGIPHRAYKDTILCGYTIPKDTMLTGMFLGMMTDEKVWKFPHEFNPENFLENGKLVIHEKYFPFGVGKHRCMGELMGKSNLFMFITTLLQNFHFRVPPGKPIPTDVPTDGATPSVCYYEALIVPRE